jgi:ZIP family zinc transporter
MNWFINLSPVLQALIATGFTYGVTALGAATVFIFKTINKKVLNGMLGFAAGVMIAASFWSLLNPAIEMAEESGMIPWVPALIGFLVGGGFLACRYRYAPSSHRTARGAGGVKTGWKRSVLLVLAITLHNIPEGLAVGVAFGAATANFPAATLTGAVALAMGIGLQNFPEGAAVSVPLRREGLSRWKSFVYGQASGLVEPIAGVIGAFAVVVMKPLLPYALSFAAGAMIYVVVEELIPEAQQEKQHSNIGTVGAMLGFAIMMLMDVALG